MDEQRKSETLQAVADHLRYLQTMGREEIPRRYPDSAAPQTHRAPERLEDIRADIGECTRCKLCRGRTHIVFGVGDPRAALMFVGEGPGADEDAKGEPFVGRAGQLLDKIIEAMGYRRKEVYIANIAKCRPPQNRAPDPEEIATCIPFLYRQVAAIRPQVIVCLGGIAAQALLKTDTKISSLRGRFHPLPPLPDGTRLDLHVMPTFHPAYLLRNPEQKRAVWEDMKKVAALLKPKT
ncbi:MAG: uracil-DNA glycosylase [Deltaproteobacteria bacterium]|nr:uracil-DNA glycosylase [Deltaproteobacteria bacterium]